MKMEQKTAEKKESLRELLYGAGRVFDNPILMAIVEAGQSPKAVDEHIKKLGWPNEVARRARNATRIKENFPLVWPELKTDHRRPREIFSFSSKSPPFLQNLGIQMSFETCFEGCVASRGTWPHLLNEFIREGKDGGFLSTFDGVGIFDIDIVPAETGIDTLFAFCGEMCFDLNTPDFNFYIYMHETNFMFNNLTKPDQAEWLDIKGKTIMLMGCDKSLPSHFGSRNPSPFPTFYKILEIKEEGRRKSKEDYDRVRIIVRQDFGPPTEKIRQIGICFFERIIPICPDSEMVLTVDYVVEESETKMYMSRLMPVGRSLIELKIYEFLKPVWQIFDAEKIARASKELAHLTQVLYSGSAVTNLEIADFKILKKPPRRLVDLLIKKES